MSQPKRGIGCWWWGLLVLFSPVLLILLVPLVQLLTASLQHFAAAMIFVTLVYEVVMLLCIWLLSATQRTAGQVGKLLFFFLVVPAVTLTIGSRLSGVSDALGGSFVVVALGAAGGWIAWQTWALLRAPVQLGAVLREGGMTDPATGQALDFGGARAASVDYSKVRRPGAGVTVVDTNSHQARKSLEAGAEDEHV